MSFKIKYGMAVLVVGAILLYASMYVRFYKSLTSLRLYIPIYTNNQSFLGLFATQDNLSEFHRNINSWLNLQVFESNEENITSLKRNQAKFSSRENNSSAGMMKVMLKPCPDKPPGLLGTVVFHHFTRNMSDLEKLFYTSDVGQGGRFKPKGCKAKQKLAIIIPYRDRRKHLLDFLHHYIPILKRQQLEFTIYVIDQGGNETFNRGILLNIGYTEALKQDNYDCFIFHDVDTYPLNDRNMYQCGDKPLHLAVAVEKYGFKLPYTYYFGAATAFNRTHYALINGFSNLYFGWGGEDDDQGKRLHQKGLQFARRSPQVSKYASANHGRDSTNPMSKDRFGLLWTAVRRMDYDGLNSLIYKVTSIEFKKLYTHITITVDRQLLNKNLKEKRTLS